MVEIINRTRTNQKLQAVRAARKKVEDRIKKILAQLKRLESTPGSPPWVSFSRVKTVAELQSSGPPLQQALRQDLALLKSHLRELDRKLTGIRVTGPQQGARKSSQEFKKRLDEALKNAEKTGVLPEDELIQLRTEAEEVVKKFIGVLNASPTEKNIEHVLGELEIPLLLGSNIDRGVCSDAMRAVTHATEKVVEKSDKVFRKNPTAANLDQLLQARETANLTGGKVRDKPENWKSANTTHPVVSGDTLSGISEYYYGDQSHWDVIYFANYGVIGDNVRQLRIGATLRIP